MAKRKKIPDLGPLEFRLMEILWEQPGLTAPEVLELYNSRADKPLAYTTVMTLLGRLVDKGMIEANRERQPYRFSPVVKRDQIYKQRVREFVDLFFGGKAIDLMVNLVKSEGLTEESIRRLEEAIDENKSAASEKRRLSRKDR
jgi:BlaI family penicillinase repressor